MRAWAWASALVFGSMMAVACGDDAGDGGDGNPTDTGTGTGTGTPTSTGTGTGTGTSTATGTGTGTGAGNCGDLVFNEAPCEECMNTSCCTEKAACASGTDCDQVLQCILFSCDGTDPTCEDTCKSMNAAGGTAYDAMNTCSETQCPTCIGAFCGTTIGFPSGFMNLCVNDNCCASANPCVDDPTCNACLLSAEPGPDCEANPLYTAFQGCVDTNCPTDICGSGIGFYANDGADPVTECNACASTNCCDDMLDCADPTMDGNTGQGDLEVEACLLCLQDDPACVGGAIATAADAFNACLTASCAAECGN